MRRARKGVGQRNVPLAAEDERVRAGGQFGVRAEGGKVQGEIAQFALRVQFSGVPGGAAQVQFALCAEGEAGFAEFDGLRVEGERGGRLQAGGEAPRGLQALDFARPVVKILPAQAAVEFDVCAVAVVLRQARDEGVGAALAA